MKTVLTILILMLTLNGCAQMQLSTAWALRDVDYLMLDPRVARMAVAFPEGAILEEVILELSFTRDGKLEMEHRIPFDILTRGVELERVGFTTAYTANIVFRIPANRIEDVRAYQRALLGAREGGLNASASMGISSRFNPQWLNEYCAAGNSSFKLKAWVLVNDFEGYLSLIRESEIMQLLNVESENFCLND